MVQLAVFYAALATGFSERCDTSPDFREELRMDVTQRLESLGYTSTRGTHSCAAETGGAGAGNPESNTCLFEFPKMLPSKLAPLKSAFQMQDVSDVLVYVGCVPPQPAPLYMGYTPYLAGFDLGSAVQGKPMGQIADTLNQLVMNTTGRHRQPWGATLALILTSDQTSDADARAALQAAGFPKDAVNTIVLPEEQLDFGTGLKHNYFVLGGRVGPFLDLADRDAHLASSNESFLYFHAKRRESAVRPFPATKRRNRTGVNDEEPVKPLVAALIDSICTWAKQRDWSVKEVLPLTPMLRDGIYSNGTECVTNRSTTGCFGDTDDAAYLISGLVQALPQGHLDIIVGSNQAATGMAVYSSAAVYTAPAGGGQASTLGGMAMSSFEYAGSAQRYVSKDFNASQLFAVDVRYAGCEPGERWCLNATVTDKDHVLTYVTRAYLNPETGTGPDPYQLAQAFVVRLQPGPMTV